MEMYSLSHSAAAERRKRGTLNQLLKQLGDKVICHPWSP